MDRTACVDLPAFPLQLALRRHPGWSERPVAVVESDKPQARILWVNERARARRILPGMRYAEGLSLAGGLHADVVPRHEIERAVAGLVRRLRDFSPHVEPCKDDPGTFWLDASGLQRLHPSLKDWGKRIRRSLQDAGLVNTIVVGYSRFGTYALARSRRDLLVLQDPLRELQAARNVPLDRLTLDPAIRDTLRKLGVRTVGRFIDLPAEGITRRFGKAALALHRQAAGLLELPLQPEPHRPAAVQRLALDHPENNVQRLLVGIERLLRQLLQMLADRGEALTRIHLGFQFERLNQHVEKIRPAAPTLDARQLLELIRLRLEALRRLPDGVVELAIAADSIAAAPDQLRLYSKRPRRDLAAAGRALARLRAELGDAAVVRAALREGHLPEANFEWKPVEQVPPPRPREIDGKTLVRRIYDQPRPLPSRPRHEPDGWMLRDLSQGPVVRIHGPYILSGGWWRRALHREYHFAETQKGELLWVYYDRPRRRWFMQGRVE